jgi:hypothetical protein
MKRVRRWIFNGLAGLSLLLCIAAIPAWCANPIKFMQATSEPTELIW